MTRGECLGLRWEDLDFENRTIDVNHNLVHRRVDEEGGTLHINTPKTKAGCRTVPMIQQVYAQSKGAEQEQDPDTQADVTELGET